MQKIAINRCYGGFGLSKEAVHRLKELLSAVGEHPTDEQRTDPQLIQVIEELGTAAEGPCADLRIVEVPDGVEWTIEEYDGLEWVAEKHRTWR